MTIAVALLASFGAALIAGGILRRVAEREEARWRQDT